MFTVNSDGRASTGEIDAGLDDELNLHVKAINITDNGGSGVNKVRVELTDGENKDKKVKRDMYESNDIWVMDDIDVYNDLFKGEKILVEVYASDNVGNESKLYSKVEDLLTIHGDLQPTISKQGQAINFDIVTQGHPYELKIDFPKEISDLDPELENGQITIPIEQKNWLRTPYKYSLPLYLSETLNKEKLNEEDRIKDKYKFTVTAYKRNGKSVSCDLYLDVRDNILQGIRTRIKE